MARPVCPRCGEEVSFPVFDREGRESHWLCVPPEDRPAVRKGFVPERRSAWVERMEKNAKVLA